jgi:predicted HTH domain antitoxin
METQSKATMQAVLEQFQQRKISTQKAARLLDLSHAEFTRLASEAGVATSTCYEPQPELVEKIFGRSAA